MAVNVRFFRLRGWTKIAVLATTDAIGQDGERGIDAALALAENKSMSLVAREHFNATDLSVTAQISRIKASGAQAVIAYAVGTPMGTVFRGMSDGGLNIPTAVLGGNLIYPFMKQYQSILPAQFMAAAIPCVAGDALPSGPVKNAVLAYQAAFKSIGIRADTSEVLAWDAGWIIINAYRKIGAGATAAQINKYVSDLDGFGAETRSVAGGNESIDYGDAATFHHRERVLERTVESLVAFYRSESIGSKGARQSGNIYCRLPNSLTDPPSLYRPTASLGNALLMYFIVKVGTVVCDDDQQRRLGMNCRPDRAGSHQKVAVPQHGER